MRRLAITAVLLLLASAFAVAQQSASDQAQGAGSQAAGAASNAAGATKSGAESGYNKTKNAMTGDSNDQNTSNDQNNNQTTEQQTNTQTTTSTAHKKLPQTASPLPLLGLLGLGTFSLGLWKARFLNR